MLKYLFFAAFILKCLWLSAQSGEKFLSIDEDDGLSGNVITCMLKDSRGFMWFGTQNGLNRFDGYEFIVYTHNDSLAGSISGNYIRSLFEDSQGNIWAGTDKNGLNRFNRKSELFDCFTSDEKNPGTLPGNTVTSITESGSGDLLIGTNQGLCKWNPKKPTFENITLNLKGNVSISGFIIETMLIQDEKILWIGTDLGLIKFIMDDSVSFLYRFEEGNLNSISNNTVNCLFTDSKNNLLIGTNEGLNVFDAAGNKFIRDFYFTDSAAYANRSEIHAITEDNKGNIWAGTFGGGLIKYNILQNSTEIYLHNPGVPESLTNDYIYSLLSDKAGLLWIGTYGGGINKLEMISINLGSFSSIPDKTNSLAGSDVYAVYPDGEKVWFGTNNGLSIYDHTTGRFINLHHEREINSSIGGNVIYAILGDCKGNLWFGTAGNGISKLTSGNREKDNYEFIRLNDHGIDQISKAGSNILCLYQAHDSSIWAGTSHGIKIIRNNRLTDLFSDRQIAPETMLNEDIYCFHQDSEFNMWIGSFSGIYKFNSKDSTVIKFGNIVSGNHLRLDNIIYCIFEDSDGFLWIGTDNRGLLMTDKAKTKIVNVYTTRYGMPDNVIYGIMEDGEKNLWLSTNNGLVKAIKNNNHGNLTFITYTTNNGLKSNAFNIGAYATDSKGNLYFGSSEGVTFFHPGEARGNITVPPVKITGFQLFFNNVTVSSDASTPLSTSIAETEKLVLNHDQNVLSFRFAALNFIQSHKNKYAFKMENLDQNWHFVENQRVAQYLYMPPGEYTFIVKASNNDGVWNEQGTSISIIIKPPFTQTIWFLLIVITVLIFVIFRIIQFRTRQLRRMKENLEKQVQKRTTELKQKNDSLNHALEELKKTQTQLVDAEKMASLGQLTAGVAHEINNPINFVSGNVKPLRRDINEILELVKKYDRMAEEQNPGELFRDIQNYKKSIDFGMVVDEINELLNGIGEGASRTAEIVRGLRNFSRMDEHELKLSGINQGLESTLLILHNKMKNRIEVVRDFGELPDIMCYPGQLNQVFMNILNNALEAIEDKGTIMIRTRHEGDFAKISIRDNGKGIPETIINRIFDPFFTTKDVGKGTGLGLSISFGIIEKHNGTIEVKSKSGEGSEFIIILPVEQPKNN